MGVSEWVEGGVGDGESVRWWHCWWVDVRLVLLAELAMADSACCHTLVAKVPLGSAKSWQGISLDCLDPVQSTVWIGLRGLLGLDGLLLEHMSGWIMT